MDPLRVIGITGEAESGKDTIAGHLVSRHGYTRIALADGMRSAFDDLDGPTWQLRKEIEKAGTGPRWTMQILGTECREDLADEAARLAFWSNLMLIKIRYLSHYHPRPRRRFVVPDVRFPHEPAILGEGLGRWAGELTVWRVERAGAGLKGDAGRHVSETGQGAIRADWTVRNDGSFDDLFCQVDRRL